MDYIKNMHEMCTAEESILKNIKGKIRDHKNNKNMSISNAYAFYKEVKPQLDKIIKGASPAVKKRISIEGYYPQNNGTVGGYCIFSYDSDCYETIPPKDSLTDEEWREWWDVIEKLKNTAKSYAAKYNGKIGESIGHQHGYFTFETSVVK